MADNIAVTAGSGTNVATDDISSTHYQRIKLIHGADGTNDGDVSTANGLPVKEVLNSISFSGGATGSLYDDVTSGFSSELACGATSTLVAIRSEFKTTASDSCVVRVWYEDAAGIWTAGSLYTVTGTAIADGSGPGSAVTLEQTGTWYFGTGFTVDVRGWTTICLEITTAPTTGVSMWGEQV